MRRFPLFAAVGLLLMLAACKKYEVSSQGTSAANKHQLYDWREDSASGGGATSASKNGNIQAANIQEVYAALFPGYSSSAGRCKAHGGGAHGPRVLASSRGTFQVPGEAPGAGQSADKLQTAYLIDPGNCAADDSGESSLAIFSGGRLLSAHPVNATAILGTYDLDEDGISELLLANAAKQSDADPQEAVVITAFLAQFKKDRFVVEENFGRVRYQTCSPGQQDGAMNAIRVLYLPEVDLKTGAVLNKMPRFTAELYRAPCPTAGETVLWVRLQE
ncbi:MAG TPA: hypothetical protein VG892_07020 [Terriglobales bacterium]|nr:hypothetical protein [Terriglobales bacterium]